ncbi:hypothetical protein C8J57DRAFT_1524043 [Mycena rebaudengoi]|nr:hypothetical protein C8J57DRAFT_1524043 [Mycena rebaudengoi]
MRRGTRCCALFLPGHVPTRLSSPPLPATPPEPLDSRHVCSTSRASPASQDERIEPDRVIAVQVRQVNPSTSFESYTHPFRPVSPALRPSRLLRPHASPDASKPSLKRKLEDDNAEPKELEHPHKLARGTRTACE